MGGVPSFTAVRAQIERAGCVADPDCVLQTASGATLIEAGNREGAYGIATAAPGVNGALASVAVAQGQEAYAESIWSDGFIVSGGTGMAEADITVRIDGVLGGLGQPGGPGPNAFYALFVSDTPVVCDFDALDCSGRAAIPLT